MNEHGEAIESDLSRFHHVNLFADLGTDRLTWRRLDVLLRHLPRESSFVQAVGGDAARWSDSEHLLAGVIDVLQVGNYLTTRAHFKGNPPKPKPIRRPGESTTSGPPKRAKRPYTQAEMKAVLDNWNEPPVTTETLEVSDGS